MVIEVLRSLTQSTKTKPAAGNCNCLRDPKRDRTSKPNVDQFSHVDHVTTNAHASQGESQLYIFVDNEAVIKMITKGRRPTDRVALAWLFDRINLDTKIQSKYVDTKNPTRRHVDQKETSRVMSGTIFFVCLIS